MIVQHVVNFTVKCVHWSDHQGMQLMIVSADKLHPHLSLSVQTFSPSYSGNHQNHASLELNCIFLNTGKSHPRLCAKLFSKLSGKS